ncbi:MAG: DUF5989 family protein [Planctomycetota bacterium]|jgi:hypothetical protein|nr:DUF5989 family protein [Planctomycetota bacterium]
MRFFKHLGRLLKDFFGFAWQNKAWWMMPVVLMLLLMGLLITTTQVAAPYLYNFW